MWYSCDSKIPILTSFSQLTHYLVVYKKALKTKIVQKIEDLKNQIDSRYEFIQHLANQVGMWMDDSESHRFLLWWWQISKPTRMPFSSLYFSARATLLRSLRFRSAWSSLFCLSYSSWVCSNASWPLRTPISDPGSTIHSFYIIVMKPQYNPIHTMS